MNQYWRELREALIPYFKGLGLYMLGVLTGALGMLMVWHEVETKPKPQSVLSVRIGDKECHWKEEQKRSDLETQIKTLNAKIDANYTQQLQRQKEVRFKADKLELAKQVHDAQLVTAQDGADDIRKIAAELGVSRMVVK
jgi:TolA-binding protein